MKKAAPSRAPLRFMMREEGLRRLLLLDGRLLGRRGRDLDLAGLQLFRNAADEVDMEQAVLKARALDFDMLGNLEMALEGASGDAAMQELRGLRLRLGLAADSQRVVL